MKLSEMRDLVRVQTETTEGELPNTTLNWYLRQAFDRTIAMENQWPFFEKTWTLTLSAGSRKITIPADLNLAAIESFRDDTSGMRLVQIDMGKADEWFGGLDDSAGTAHTFYAPWAGEFHLFPQITFAASRTFTVSGHRLATDWIAAGPDSEPDCDERLHRPLIHYAIALAYEQQEDEQLGTQYMARYERDVMQARSAIMEPSHQRPAIMGPRGYPRIGSGPTWPSWRVSVP